MRTTNEGFSLIIVALFVMMMRAEPRGLDLGPARLATTHLVGARHAMTAHDPITPPEYRDIPGFPGYRVSIGGKVESRWGTSGHSRGRLVSAWHVIRPKVNRVSGHLFVNMRRDGTTFTRTVHRLVLEAFVGPCPPGLECRHIDSNPANNDLGNLAWGTRAENIADRLGRGQVKVDAADVAEIRLLHGLGMMNYEIGAVYGIHGTTVCNIVRRKTWKHV